VASLVDILLIFMPTSIYCWRCRTDMPMLAEDEWQRIAPLLADTVSRIKEYRQKHQCSIAEARSAVGAEVLDSYERITGFRETNVNAIYHHRLSLYGPPCGKCAKPLRTPQARYCAMCDWQRPGFLLRKTGADDASA
jgi:hypothetical protein